MRRGKQINAAHNICHALGCIVDGDGQVIAGWRILAGEHDITMGGPKREEMLERAPTARTVPQIFIGATHVGGSDELAALEREGKLDALLTG